MLRKGIRFSSATSERTRNTMDHASAEWMVRLYVEGWKEGNRAKILGSLDPACVIIESDGLTHRGVEKIGRWIDTWLGDGNEVNRWDIIPPSTSQVRSAFLSEYLSAPLPGLPLALREHPSCGSIVERLFL